MASDQSIRNFPPDPSACPLFLTFPTSGGGGVAERVRQKGAGRQAAQEKRGCF